MHITTASIHDLLAACDCALTVTSAVGFEAFLHKKPVVLGGQDLGGSSAQSVILMIVVVLLTVVQFRFIERKVHY